MAIDHRASSGGRQGRGTARCRIAVPTAAVAMLVVVTAVGCVQRRMTIRSNPPGALVYVDDYQIGTTPVSHDFVYYGTRKIRLVKDGYETLTVRQPFPLPWYQVFPLDFVTENLWPGEIRDERIVDLAMQPAGAVTPESIVSRAEQVRLAAGSLPPVSAVPAPPPSVPPSAPRPVPAPPPAVPPLQQYAPAPQYPQPPQFVPTPPSVPPQPLPPPNPGFQAPFRNAPSQGVPSLGAPPVP
jgi:hypothetical protein